MWAQAASRIGLDCRIGLDSNRARVTLSIGSSYSGRSPIDRVLSSRSEQRQVSTGRVEILCIQVCVRIGCSLDRATASLETNFRPGTLA